MFQLFKLASWKRLRFNFPNNFSSSEFIVEPRKRVLGFCSLPNDDDVNNQFSVIVFLRNVKLSLINFINLTLEKSSGSPDPTFNGTNETKT